MFALLIFIVVNIVFILFYLQVEPVFLPACLNKAIQITSVSSISATDLNRLKIIDDILNRLKCQNVRWQKHITEEPIRKLFISMP